MATAGMKNFQAKSVTAVRFAAIPLALLILSSVLLALLPAGAKAQVANLPALSGRIVDNAGMLDQATRELLENELAAFEAKSSDQVVVATIPTLADENLEDYANRLFRHWQLGQAGENNGVLLLVARDDRKIRIEVGYGLEGTLTDALSRTIIDVVIVPAFKAGDFSSGISEGARMIIRVLSGDEAELRARAERNRDRQSQGIDWFMVIFFSVWGLLFFGPVLFAILARQLGKKIGKNHYRWLGIDLVYGGSRYPGSRSSGSSRSGGGWSGGSSSGGGFSGGGGSSGGGGASGGW